MLGKILYNLKTWNYFDPKIVTKVTQQDLVNILKWKIKCPYGWGPLSYEYFVLSRNWLDLDNIPEKFEPRMVSIFNLSQWFWLFSTKHTASIVVPLSHTIYLNSNALIKTNESKSIWEWWGCFSLNECRWKDILLTNVSLNVLNDLLENLFP